MQSTQAQRAETVKRAFRHLRKLYKCFARMYRSKCSHTDWQCFIRIVDHDEFPYEMWAYAWFSTDVASVPTYIRFDVTDTCPSLSTGTWGQAIVDAINDVGGEARWNGDLFQAIEVAR